MEENKLMEIEKYKTYSNSVSSLEEFKTYLKPYKYIEKIKIINAAILCVNIHKNVKRASGEYYYTHPLTVAKILIDLKMDFETVQAGLLHDVIEDTYLKKEDIEKRFSKTVADLVDGVTKIENINFKHMDKNFVRKESIRKTILSMADDNRVIIIKLADKLHNMLTLDFLNEEKRIRTAEECLEIFVPLSARIGMNSMKNSLETLCIKYLDPENHRMINSYINNINVEDERIYIEEILEKIKSEAKKRRIKVVAKGRFKNFLSIYKKIKKKGIAINQIHDFVGIRLICNTVNECFLLLNIVHSNWMYLEESMKDYINNPKSNGYQSLHTVVKGKNGIEIEFQIRTDYMDKIAENGIAAHFKYKLIQSGKRKLKKEDLEFEKRMAELEKGLKENRLSNEEFFEAAKEEILKDTVRVFTKDGTPIELPIGSTAIDFAYKIHKDIGNSLYYALANRKPISIKVPLQNSWTIEIITNENSAPNIGWLSYVKTTKAKKSIKEFLFKSDAIEKNLIITEENEDKLKGIKHSRSSKYENSKKLIVKNKTIIGHYVSRFGKCCAPKVGDDLIGYISNGKGLIIHKKNCSAILSQADERRLIKIEWMEKVNIHVYNFEYSCDSGGSKIFKDFDDILEKYKDINTLSFRLENIGSVKNNIYQVKMTLEIINLKEVSLIENELSSKEYVISIKTNKESSHQDWESN